MTSDIPISSEKRPALAIRVGITGSRVLPDDQHARLRGQMREVLGHVREQIDIYSQADHTSRAAYAATRDGDQVVGLRMVSPLAIGADRLAAHEALDLGYRLHVPMPFSKQEYALDFKGHEGLFASDKHLEEFNALIERADGDLLALDGRRNFEPERAYEAVGRYVVRHVDVMIAIWDGDKSNGKGGTAEIVEHAVRTGVPVWTLHPKRDQPPNWISDVAELHAYRDEFLVRHGQPVAEIVPASDRLRAYFAALIPPPPPSERSRHGVWRRAVRLGQSRECMPETDYFSAEQKPRGTIWRIHSGVMTLLTLGYRAPPTEARRPAEDKAVEDDLGWYWHTRYTPADASATESAGNYRSSYAWVILSGMVAVTLAAVAPALSHLDPTHPRAIKWGPSLFAAGELLALIWIFRVLLLSTRLDWHEHAVEYRVLAEVFRKQRALAIVGWSLPIDAVRDLAAPTAPDANRGDRSAWVSWLFAAEQRGAPLPTGDMGADARAFAGQKALQELIDGQVAYHGDRARMAAAASRRLDVISVGGFIGVSFILLLKVAALLPATGAAGKLAVAIGVLRGWTWLFAIISGALSALAVATAAFRSYAELEVLTNQSHHMMKVLNRARRRIDRLDVARPLASQDIGAEAAIVATQMLRDLEGWASLFRVKGVEPG